MKKAISVSFAAFVFALCAFAQTISAQCPKIEVLGPAEAPANGLPIKFTANVTGGDPFGMYPKNWSVSPGRIIRGQATSEITVDMTGATNFDSITVTVELGGVIPSCARTSSLTIKRASAARKFDEYSGLKGKDEEARLIKVVLDLFGDRTNDVYIISYGGKKSPSKEAEAGLTRVKAYLRKAYVDEPRIFSVNGGNRDVATIELWLVPPGSAAPKATPLADPK